MLSSTNARFFIGELAKSRMAEAVVRRGTKGLAAVLQLTSTENKDENYEKCLSLIREAKKRYADVIFLPEAFDYIGRSSKETKEKAEAADGPLIRKYRSLAKELGVCLSLGGFHEDPGDGSDLLSNTHLFIDSSGNITGKYSKTHLFDVDSIKESDYVRKGSRIVPPVDSPIGRIALGICYDLRFPEMSLSLTKMGATVLTYPSAFTVPTGLAHWEALLRARAIENQAYVIAAAQTGKHNDKRSSYGHSMIVDPWGAIVAQCSEGQGIAVAEIDDERLRRVRSNMPVFSHRRNDLYGLCCLDDCSVADDSGPAGEFGTICVPSEQMVMMSNLSLVIVNKKPVVPYHLLVLPKRKGLVRLRDLSCEETSDLFNMVRKAQVLVEGTVGTQSSTVTVQDGEDAGQTVKHVHVHVLPRTKADFVRNDRIYEELEDHDKAPVDDPRWRSDDEMHKEAQFLRRQLEQMQRVVQSAE